ncbi:MAG TPA: cobalamin biosynthesis protein [Actinomycetota bacterium]|nr:cobalamin biosynthesis protein [Actinomycetota bacterium]
MATVAAVALGWLADRALGDPARHHPVAGFGMLATRTERLVWWPSRGRGTLYAVTLVAGTGMAAAGLGRVLRRIPGGSVAAGTVVLWTTLGGRSLERVAGELAGALEAGDLGRARALLPSLAGRDPTHLDAAGLCRAGLESVAENTADAVVGPLLWGAVAGAPGAAMYRAANTLDAMVGHRSPRYERFGWAAARLDDLLTWPAARLGALLMVALAGSVHGDRARAWAVLRRDGASHPSPNAGRMEAAAAGALGVRLGGTNVYGERVEHRPTLGDGPPPGPADLRRAIRLSRATGWAAAALCMLLAAARRRSGESRHRRVLCRSRCSQKADGR